MRGVHSFCCFGAIALRVHSQSSGELVQSCAPDVVLDLAFQCLAMQEVDREFRLVLCIHGHRPMISPVHGSEFGEAAIDVVRSPVIAQ